MKMHRLVLSIASSVLLASCAYVPFNPTTERRVSPDYAASGSLEGVRAYVYADRTVVDFERAEPTFLIMRDAAGEAVPFEKMGRLFRLDRKLNAFTLWLNGASATFTAAARTQVFAGQADDAVVASPEPAQAIIVQAPVTPTAEDADIAALLNLSQVQLEEVRQALTAASRNPQSTGAETAELNARMDAIEARVLAAASAIVRVSFPTSSTRFNPGDAVAQVLIRSARDSQTVNVHGHTDARNAGNDDARIALGRALAARSFLVGKGIDAKKINVFSTAAGDFTAPNSTKDGRAINRRVDFEFVNARIAAIKGQVQDLAGK